VTDHPAAIATPTASRLSAALRRSTEILATPSIAASWVQHRLTASPDALAIIYAMQSEWPAVQSAVASLTAQMRSYIRWWIADPTGYPHVVPGSDATRWYWGSSYDISAALLDF